MKTVLKDSTLIELSCHRAWNLNQVEQRNYNYQEPNVFMYFDPKESSIDS